MMKKIRSFFFSCPKSCSDAGFMNLPLGLEQPIVVKFWEHNESKGRSHLALKLPARGEKPPTYISFGFTIGDSPKGAKKPFSILQGSFKTEAQDYYEGGASWLKKDKYKSPQEVKLYNLDVERMHQLLLKFLGGVSEPLLCRSPSHIPNGESINLKWTKLGHCLESPCCGKTKHNCSSLVYALLKEGGLAELIPYSYGSRRFLIISFVLLLLFVGIGILGGNTYDRARRKKDEFDESEFAGAALGVVITLSILAILYCTGYVVTCSVRGVDHISRPDGVFKLASAASQNEAQIFAVPENPNGHELGAVVHL